MTFSQGWSSFTRRIFINKDVHTVYSAWSKSAELEKWFFKSAEYCEDEKAIDKTAYVQRGHTCKWQWHGWPHIHTGTILEAKLNEILKFDFNPGGNVCIHFIPISEQRMELVLEQTDIPHGKEDDIKHFYYGCSLGWSFWMLNLKAFLEHGIVLNEMTNPYADDPKKLELVNH